MRNDLMKVSLMVILIIVGISSNNITNMASSDSNIYRSVGYFYQENGDINDIDVTKMTHLNYSFGLIYHNEVDSNREVPIDDSKLNTIYLSDKVKSDLKLIPDLRKKNKNLEVLLAVGGWECRGFSGAAATKESREQFANSALEIINEYGLDGINIDWQYPVNGAWGVIDSSSDDKANYTLLLQAIREKIGEDKLLAISGPTNKKFLTAWTEFNKIVPIVDYINVMTYDLAYGGCYNNAPLYESQKFKTVVDGDNYTVDKVIESYLNAGATPGMLNLGIAFYGRIPQISVVGARPIIQPMFSIPNLTEHLIKAGAVNSDFKDDKSIKYSDLVEFLINKNGFTRGWDEDAKVPYLTHKDENGEEKIAISYDDSESIEHKTNYIKEKKLGGVMFLDIGSDYENTLITKLANDLSIGVNSDTNENNLIKAVMGLSSKKKNIIVIAIVSMISLVVVLLAKSTTKK
ncbi:MAG: glycoside hydrolase family 18 protein [Clostridium sp.]